MKYNLFLDDERIPQNVTWVNLPSVNWTIVRNYNQFVDIIEKQGIPEIISFDHDLADEHYMEYTAAHDSKSPTKGRINYDKLKEKTGYECAKWLAQYCIDNSHTIPEYYIHTMNPIGGMNILSILESAKQVISKS
jgi:hypothetical protein